MSLYKLNFTADEDMIRLLQSVGDPSKETALAASREFAQALQEPLRQAVLDGSIVGGVFDTMVLQPGSAPEFSLDLVTPGLEDEHVAYTIPSHGRLPQKLVEATYVMIPTFEVGSTIHIKQKIARDARWDVMSRMMQVIEAGVVKKMNDDAFHALLAAGLDRNILVYDSDAAAGYLSKRLISLLKVTMRRNGGGNSTSLNRRKLTHVFVSPEAMEDMRNWGLDQLADVDRARMFAAPDGSLNGVFPGLSLVDLDELGVGQVYQTYFTSDLAGSLQASDVELVIGANLGPNKSLVMPFRENVSIDPDDSFMHERKIGWKAYTEYGVGILDNRDVLLGSM